MGFRLPRAATRSARETWYRENLQQAADGWERQVPVRRGSESATHYSARFFDEQRDDSLRSAELTVPLLISLTKPRAVIDVGCGTGTWLRAFSEAGIEDVLGVDGDYVDRRRLLIAPEHFLARDLTKPLNVGRTFDLALSLEVAEHLPASAADSFVQSLCSLAPVVVFSAAVPEQQGPGHVNEQWPWYWHRRFEANGFAVLDILRPRLWRDSPGVANWYLQNLYLMVRRDAQPAMPELAGVTALQKTDPMLLISSSVLVSNLRLRATLRRLPGLIASAAIRLIARKARNWPWQDG